MSTTEPKHGTPYGARHHWTAGEKPCEPCRRAALRARKRNRYLNLIGQSGTVPAVGTIRRIHALMALGWTQLRIADEADLPVNTVRSSLYRQGQSVYRGTHEAVAGAYERLCMTFPPETTTAEKREASYVRGLARKNGWFPPLAWDDIDDPDETPVLEPDRRRPNDDVDPAVVEALLEGRHVDSTRAEKDAAMRRWLALGRSERSLCELHGWHDGRYGKSEGEAA